MMKNPFIKVAVVLAATFFLPVLGSGQEQPAIIQQLPPQLRQDAYVADLAVMLDQWNESRLELGTKTDLRPSLTQRLEQIVMIQRYSYETALWSGGVLKQFDELPNQIRPDKKLDASAEMVLILLFLKDRHDFERHVSLKFLRQELRLPLFLILGRAEVLARARQAALTVDANTISRSVLDWWTTIWPFCD
jgi:hypothetical protein